MEFGKLNKSLFFFLTLRGPGSSVRCHLDFLGEACSSPGVGTSTFYLFFVIFVFWITSFRQIPSCGDRKRCVSGKELAEMKSWEEKAGLGVGSASVCPTCCLESFVVHKTPNEEAKTAEIFAQT